MKDKSLADAKQPARPANGDSGVSVRPYGAGESWTHPVPRTQSADADFGLGYFRRSLRERCGAPLTI